MNQSSNNASGAGVGVLAAMRAAVNALRPVSDKAERDGLIAAIATIESARKALQLASRRFSDQNGEVSAKVWNDNYDAVKAINDALTAFGPAPPTVTVM